MCEEPNSCPFYLLQPKVKHTKLLIGGSWVESESGQRFKTINPANEETLAEVSQATTKDVEKAVAAARHAFDKGTPNYKVVLFYLILFVQDPGLRQPVMRGLAC
jgi:hypothetical protein